MALPRARGLYLSFGSYESRFLQTRCGVGRRRVQFYGIAYRYLFAYSLGILISIEDKTKDKLHVRILVDSDPGPNLVTVAVAVTGCGRA